MRPTRLKSIMEETRKASPALYLIIVAAFALLIANSFMLARQVATALNKPPIQYLVDAPLSQDVCPGDVLTWKISTLITDAPSVTFSYVNVWSVDKQIQVVKDELPSALIWPVNLTAHAMKVWTVPELPPGPYQRLSATVDGGKPAIEIVPFVILANCEKAKE